MRALKGFSIAVPALALAFVAELCVAPRATRAQTATIAIAGSTSLLSLARAASATYENAHPDVTLTVSGGGSREALRSLAAGNIDVAASDSAPDAQAPSLVDHRVAVIAFALVANPTSGIASLTREQIAALYAGKIANWKEVGGADRPAIVIGRSIRSGITATLARTVLDGAVLQEGTLFEEATASALAAVRATPGAVTLAALAPARASGLTLVALDGAAPSDENVENGTYPFWGYEHMVTAGTATTAISRFLSYLESDRALLHRFGFIGVRELGPRALARPASR